MAYATGNPFWQALADNNPASQFTVAPVTPTALTRTPLVAPSVSQGLANLNQLTRTLKPSAVVSSLNRGRSARTAQNYSGKARSARTGTPRYGQRRVGDRMSRKYRSFG